MRIKKTLKIILISIMFSGLFSITIFAGQWKRDNVGWWYDNGDGTYLNNGWYWIDSFCYYFTIDGYCLVNTTTPDGFTVDANGIWNVDGIIQRKDDISQEEFIVAIVDYYSNTSSGNGTYMIFDSETKRDEVNYYFILRYQMSEEEAQNKIRNGGDLAANIYVDEITANKSTGVVKSLCRGEFLQLK